MSEKANDLLNKFGSTQFDFMVWNTPDNLVARDKARQEISDYIAELEAAQRWVMVSERLPKVSGWYLTGLVYFWGSPYSGEVYFDAENIEPRWNNITSDKIYCWLDGVPELPQPPEVQE